MNHITISPNDAIIKTKAIFCATQGLEATLKTKTIERLSMTFTPNGKRRSEINALPKIEEPCLILAHFCPVSSIYQATSQRNETS